VFNTAVWLDFRVIAAAVPLLVVIPFMLGFYFQMLVISPLRVVRIKYLSSQNKA